MSTALGKPAFEDLTARARIRDAAVRLFGERGMDATTIRDIAAAAGVSGGLVRHHFGSKEGLRDACDSYALDQLMRLKDQAVVDRQMAAPGFLAGAQPTPLLFYRYLARSMLDGSPAAGAMFDEMVDLGERWLAEHHPGLVDDQRAYSALLVAMELGALSMNDRLSQALGGDIFSREGHLRLAKAKIDFYSRPLLSPELAAQAHAAIDGLLAGASYSPGVTRSPPRRDK
jgi:TetR/AcrR family transcriptional regulator, regulator of cefoperazone and chloramphenicol sensitivity